MKRQVGLWIDHRKAVIVLLAESGETTKVVESGVERHVRYSGGSHPNSPYGSQLGASEDGIGRRFTEHLRRYYENVRSQLGNVDSVLILGPGEAKAEFAKHLKKAHSGVHISGVEVVDKMTDHEMVARVRQHFAEIAPKKE